MLSFEEIGRRGGGKCTSISNVSSVCLGYAPLSKYNQSNNGSVCVEKHEVGGRTEDVSIKTNKNKLSCIAINWYY